MTGLERSPDQVVPVQPINRLAASTPLIYLTIWIPAVVVAGAITLGIIMAVNALGLRFTGPVSFAAVVGLNVVPPFIIGLVWYRIAARRMRERAGSATAFPGHLARAFPLYLLTILLAVYVTWGAMNWRSGFGLVAQLFVWPLVTTIGGIIGDALEWRS